ncbi:stealth conserved region 3 domain-containing protein [Actinacidiphila glaucinigra]|uniref:stealth conserved region 3 domain-containing protein n=1 Tax=Actinacidiphila glaucinigra TaxID=235986 RepID=UPI003794A507
MRITFLLTAADTMGDAERAVLQHASDLAERHEVDVISVFKGRRRRFDAPDGRVPVRFLIEAHGAVHRPVRGSGLNAADCAALASTASDVVERRWDDRFHRLADIELEYALQDIHTDVLVTTSSALMACVSRFAAPSVLTVHHEQEVPESGSSSTEPLIRYAPRYDAVVLQSHGSYEWFVETFGAGAPGLTVIPALPKEGFRPKSTLETRIVALAARLEERAGIDQALTAWARVSGDHPTWTLRVLGDGPHRGALQRRRDQLGLHGTVQFPGETSHPAEEWSKASIALGTAQTDAVGLSLREAQAAGVPVVAYDSPDVVREAVRDGYTGALVTPGDTEALAAVLGRLIDDAGLRHALGAAAADWTSERFGEPPVAERWENLLRALLDARDSGQRAVAKAARVAAHSLHEHSDGRARAASPIPSSTVRTEALVAAETRILSRDPSLVRDGGQVCRVTDAESPYDIVQANLALVADALEEAGIPYFVMRDTKVRHCVAVHEENREAVFKAIAARYRRRPVYMALLNDADVATATTLAGFATDYMRVKCAGIRVYQSVVTATRTLRLGATYGCTISFLGDDPDVPGELASPHRTLIGSRVPKRSMRRCEVTLGGRRYQSIEPFARTLHQDVPFPIDAVYTWVDGADISWLERKNSLLSSMGIVTEDAATSAARFRNRDELRYSLRSIDMYAPWIRTIYLVTDRQVPGWLDTAHPRVRVVDHTEIFGSEGALPTYNSHAIESRLHHIDGLAEHFLYFNDDVFVGRPLQPDKFFLSNGQSKHFTSSNAIPMSPVSEEDEFSRSAAKNNRELIAERFGHTLVNSFIHAPHPLRRSVMHDLEEQFPEALRRTAGNQLRSRTDVSVASSLHHYFGYYTHRSVPGGISCGFVNVGLSEQLKRLNQLLTTRSNDVFCLNDYHDGDVSQDDQDATLAAFLPSYFPVGSQFETGSPRNARFHAGQLPEWPL